MTRLAQRLTGLATTLALLAFTAGIPLALHAVGLGPVAIVRHPVWLHLLSPDDGTAAWVGLGVIAWVVWVVLVYLVALEAVAAARNVHAPRIRGLSAPQHAARTLVTWAALLFVAVPAATASIPVPAAAAFASAPPGVPAIATAAPLYPGPTHSAAAHTVASPVRVPAPASTRPVARPTTRPSPAPAHVPGTVAYTVKRGDSLWKIADRMLGDPLRYTEIAALNADRLGGTPDFITPPMVLLLPADAAPTPPAADETYTVRPGDTLSQIAEDELGDATRYPQIVDASRAITQPGGEHLVDPDLVKPGWTLDLGDPGKTQRATPRKAPRSPATTARPHDDPRASEPTSRRPDALAPSGTSNPPEAVAQAAGPAPATHATTTAPATPTPTDAAARSTGATPAAPHDAPPDRATEHAPGAGWLLPGFTGAGSLLAGSLFLTVRAHRRTRLRYRKPGQYLQPTPPDLIAVDRTADTAGAPAAPRIHALDTLLRSLAAAYPDPRDYPAVVTVELSDERATLHLAADATLPTPWSGETTTWSAPLAEPLTDPVPAGTNPPYPLLATIGSSTDGHVWLLNLEHTHSVTVTGDDERARAFVRYLAADLALNPWSILVTVHAVGIAVELAPIDPLRLTPHPAGDTRAQREIARAIDPASGVLTFDPDTLHVLLTMTPEGPEVDALIDTIAHHPTRSGAAVVVVAGPGQAESGHAGNGRTSRSVAVDISPDARLTVPSLGLDLTAVGLTSQEAADCALLAATTEDAPCVPYPIDNHAVDGPAAFVNAAGALRAELVADRPADPTEPAGATSLLPLASADYVAAAPTTAEDVATLAPVVPESTRARVLDTYPALDDDVADWFRGSACTRPRLLLLGPIKAYGKGNAAAATKRRPYLTALLGYLALHPGGVSSDELRTIVGADYRNSVKTLRQWMGTNPRTGRDHVPYADKTRAAQAVGAPRYQVDDVLVDWNLFTALRARGQARGAAGDGIEDLQLALSLVTGVPFTQGHDAWRWLDESDRLDLIAPCAVVDVAHTVVVHALATGDVPAARRAVDVAILAAPDDETARLDLIDILHAEGHGTAADVMLDERIINRTDDHHAPIEPATRTATILARRWGDLPPRVRR